MTDTTEVFVPGRGIHRIDGHVSYDEALRQGRAWLQMLIERDVDLLDRFDEWLVEHRRPEWRDGVPVPEPSGSTPTMRGQYCAFQMNGEACAFGLGHTVRYHLVAGERYPAVLGGVA